MSELLSENMKKAVEQNYGVGASIIPVAIAPYFFEDKNNLNKVRNKALLLFPKNVYKQLEQLDYDILTKILDKKLSKNNKKLLGIIPPHKIKARGIRMN